MDYQLLRDKYEYIVEGLYHNATPTYPKNSGHWENFWQFLQNIIDTEINYFNAGFAKFGKQNQYTSEEFVKRFGKLKLWGRGQRTAAPIKLARYEGGQFYLNTEYQDKNPINIQYLEYDIEIIAAFNSFVINWNKNLPRIYSEYQNTKNYFDFGDVTLAYQPSL